MKSVLLLPGAAILVCAALASCAGGSATGPMAADAAQASVGRDIVVRQCASCHAIDQQTVSPNAEAPAMKTLLSRYNQDALANDLIEGIRLGHDDMPLFDFNVIGADALIAYLRSL